MNRAVLVMAKMPRAGQSKTRLSSALGSDGAAELASAMLRDTVHALEQRSDCDVIVAIDPPESCGWFEAEFPRVELIEQHGETLGARLDNVLTEALQRGYRAVFAVSADSPDLPPGHLDSAFEALERPDADVVLGPTEDGGYYLIGWKRRWRDIVADVEMSTPTVLADTLTIADRVGARTVLAPRWYDVDVPDDLVRLRRSLGPSSTTHSAEILRNHRESLPPPKVAVIIPALNEAEIIGSVVHSVLERAPMSVIVVDNGSTDGTAEVAGQAGALVVSESRRGYGYACAAGSRAALDIGVDILVYMDGDGSSRASELEYLLEPLIDGEARIVLGSRALGTIEAGAMPLHQRVGNHVMAGLMRMLYRVEVTDLGPFRAIDASLYRSLSMRETTFGWPTEMMVKAAVRGEPIVEVPVSWDQRASGESKVGGTMRGSILAATHIIRVTLRHARRRQDR